MTRRGAELPAAYSRRVNQARADRTTANRYVGEGQEPCQDGPRARAKLLKGELPAGRDQGRGAGIRERSHRPLEHARGRSGLLKGGLDFRYHS